MSYTDFLNHKSQIGGVSGFKPIWMPSFLKDFQTHLCNWGIEKGRGLIAADCGLGKTPMQLVVQENFVRHTNRSGLLLTPLGVSAQTMREAEKFGVDVFRSKDGKFPSGARIVVTNYERLHHFNPSDFSSVSCDESGVLKNFDSVTRDSVTEFMRTIPFRVLCTATAAPNDHCELGTSAEALGELGYMDMLGRFFKNDSKTLHIHGQKTGNAMTDRWRFKPHAERHFWRWVCSWARACRKPSDLGFDDAEFTLPELVTREHIVKASRPAAGMLFETVAATMGEQREETHRTITERCEKVAELVADSDSAVCWCQLNDEGDLLEKIIPGAKQVSGSDSDDEKEEAFEAFSSGQIPKLVTKAKIAGFGLNWQHCNHETFFPSHSFEQFYQAVRRCWRFGQKRKVTVDVVGTEGSSAVLRNLQRKSEQADEMFSQMVSLMNESLRIGRTPYGTKQEELPSWL